MWQVASRNSTITNSTFLLTNLFIGTNFSTNYFNEFGQQTNSNSASLRMEYEARTNTTYTNAYDVNLTFYWPAHSTNTNTTTKRTFNYIFTK